MLPRSTPFLPMPSEYSIERNQQDEEKLCFLVCSVRLVLGGGGGGTLTVDRFVGSREVRQHIYIASDRREIRSVGLAGARPKYFKFFFHAYL